ncbi:MAG TPA: signal peptidase I [Gaiellaceae bacterium]|nr:signal peptidase I [Gaiellaceae bacterium]
MTATVLRRAGSALAWYVVPAFAVLTVVAYIAGAVIWHANPPAVPVAGVSMKPTLQPGDLVFLKGVDPKSLRVGDIIAVHVPKDSQSQYSLPGEIAHRIVKIQQSPTGPIFHTKGDANSGPDVFVVHSGDVIGRVVGHAPGLGYPLLFFRSNQGKIFLAAAGLVAITYFLLGLYEDRRVVAEGTAISLRELFAETQQLKAAVVANRYPVIEGGPRRDVVETDVRRIRERADQTTETVRELVGAIGEYGTHLRSHTAVMQNLAATTAELHRATAELGSAVAGPTLRHQAAQPTVEPLPQFGTSVEHVGKRPQPLPGLPLSVPANLLEQRMLLEARAARVDELLRRLSARPGEGASSGSHR